MIQMWSTKKLSFKEKLNHKIIQAFHMENQFPFLLANIS